LTALLQACFDKDSSNVQNDELFSTWEAVSQEGGITLSQSIALSQSLGIPAYTAEQFYEIAKVMRIDDLSQRAASTYHMSSCMIIGSVGDLGSESAHAYFAYDPRFSKSRSLISKADLLTQILKLNELVAAPPVVKKKLAKPKKKFIKKYPKFSDFQNRVCKPQCDCVTKMTYTLFKRRQLRCIGGELELCPLPAPVCRDSVLAWSSEKRPLYREIYKPVNLPEPIEIEIAYEPTKLVRGR
jgi:hypothetical protein